VPKLAQCKQSNLLEDHMFYPVVARTRTTKPTGYQADTESPVLLVAAATPQLAALAVDEWIGAVLEATEADNCTVVDVHVYRPSGSNRLARLRRVLDWLSGDMPRRR
jgi:hypothetical protein